MLVYEGMGEYWGLETCLDVGGGGGAKSHVKF